MWRSTPEGIAELRRLRYEEGLSRAEVAERIGCAQDTVTRRAPVGVLGPPPLSDEKQAMIRRLRYEEGVSWAETARLVGCSGSLVTKYAPRHGRVTREERREILRLRYVEHWSTARVARHVGRCEGTVKRIAPGRVGKVDNTSLREAVVRVVGRGEVSWGEIARRMGWVNGRADTPRVKKTLGLVPTPNGHGYPPSIRVLVGVDTAVRLLDAVGLDPVDVGL